MNQMDILDGIENTKMRELRQYKLAQFWLLFITLISFLFVIILQLVLIEKAIVIEQIGVIEIADEDTLKFLFAVSISIFAGSFGLLGTNAAMYGKMESEIEIENKKVIARSIVFGKFYSTQLEAEQLANSFGLKEYDHYSIEYHYSIDANWKGKSCYSILIKE